MDRVIRRFISWRDMGELNVEDKEIETNVKCVYEWRLHCWSSFYSEGCLYEFS